MIILGVLTDSNVTEIRLMTLKNLILKKENRIKGEAIKYYFFRCNYQRKD
jgi:hypothetical protein